MGENYKITRKYERKVDCKPQFCDSPKTSKMKKNVLVFGLIAGLIASVWMVISMAICYRNTELEGSMLVGYTSMVVAFSLIFVAIKNFRDKYNNGYVSFGKAFQIGLYIALIGSTMYVIAWMIEFHYFMPDFMDRFTESSLSKVAKTGTAADVAAKREEMAGYASMYKSPIMFAALTYMEILPVGLLVSLVAALILKRKPVQRVAV